MLALNSVPDYMPWVITSHPAPGTFTNDSAGSWPLESTYIQWALLSLDATTFGGNLLKDLGTD
jgi:hypothetical protein